MSDQTPENDQNPQAQAPSVNTEDAKSSAPSLDEMDADALREMVGKLRKESAKYRTERNDLKPLAEKFKELEESKKSELEKANERIAALEAEHQAAQSKLIKAQVASETGVPVELLPDGDEELVRAHAERLQEWGSKNSEPAKPKAPNVPTVGHEGGDDRDAYARKILGI